MFDISRKYHMLNTMLLVFLNNIIAYFLRQILPGHGSNAFYGGKLRFQSTRKIDLPEYFKRLNK